MAQPLECGPMRASDIFRKSSYKIPKTLLGEYGHLRRQGRAVVAETESSLGPSAILPVTLIMLDLGEPEAL